MSNDDKKEKSGSGAREVLKVADDTTNKLETENIRLREQIAELKNEVTNTKANARDGINAMQGELNRVNDRESAHIAALRALGAHTENAALNQTRFDAIAKDFENFHRGVSTINERLTKIGERLDELVAAQLRKEVL